jgi:serine protease AprX
MNAPWRRFTFLLFIVLSIQPNSFAAASIGSRLQGVLARSAPTDRIMAWVYFSDKGSNEVLRTSVPPSVVSQRSLQRRMKVREMSSLVDYTDLPVDESYVRQVAAHTVQIRNRSKWMNGVSIIASPAQIQSMAALPFVSTIDVVTRYQRNNSESEVESSPDRAPELHAQPAGINSLDYGLSLTQVNQINVPAIHDLGNHAEGVVVGVFDNGFRLLTHQAFDSLHITATYDFVDHKVSVVPNNPSTSFGAHGVNTLSTIGGYKPGQLIGPAFKANFILARTENDSSETPIEEDNWVAAIEWADSIGVDVTSTSLGYLAFDSPYTSLTWQDMNGNTSPMTRAADLAVGRGIVVVNSAGNDGLNTTHNTLGAPADGDSVLTIGAVDATGTRSSFSSVGPTTSVPARIKPDVMAMGSSVRVASSTNTTGYAYSNGTSFSCPLAAGVAALMVKAWPTASPLEIMDALRSTASRAGTPDNQYGYGIINALTAMQPKVPALVQPAQGATGQPQTVTLSWNPAIGASTYRVQLATDTAFAMMLVDDSTLAVTSRVAGSLASNTVYYWRVRSKNLAGNSAYSARRYFTTLTIPQPPPAPALVTPTNASTGQQLSGVLRWNTISAASSYHVQLSYDSSFASIILNDSTVVDTFKAYGPLTPLTKSFWRVRARNAVGYGSYSPIWYFRTMTVLPAAPALISPSDFAGNQSTAVTLSWFRSVYAEKYHVQLSTDSLFSTLLVGDSTVTDSIRTVGGLPLNRTLFWRVRAINVIGGSNFTPARRFTTTSTLQVATAISAGWNLVSLPAHVADPRASSVFVNAASSLFSFDPVAGYAMVDSLISGRGYWIRYASPDTVHISGSVIERDSVAIVPGWNLIGPFSTSIGVGLVQTSPSGILASGFFQYGAGYVQVFTLNAGAGYWIKANAPGYLIMPSNSAARIGRGSEVKQVVR